MTAETIAKGLGGKRQGGYFAARCPAHDDKNPSLSITERDGTLLVKCHAGCRQDDVLAALRNRGLWNSPGEFAGTGHINFPQKPAKAKRTISATYDYTDIDGKLLYQVVRYEPKDFRQRRPDGCGGWIWNLEGVDRVLYRLREVVEAPIVFLVEGEKDVESLREWGFVATTVAGGTGAKWLLAYTDVLREREVVLVPDHDEPGLKRGEEIARALLGNVAKLKYYRLPEGIKDITEFFERGHSECELIATLEGCHV